MATATMTRSAHGLGTIGDDWTMHVACSWETHDLLSAVASGAARAVHICRHHCPVRVQCEAYTARLVARKLAPIGVVQAGLVWVDAADARRGPHKQQPDDPGCGRWCATSMKEA